MKKILKRWQKVSQGKLFDIAAAPSLLALGGGTIVLAIVVIALVALAVWFLVKEARKRNQKNNK